MLECNYIRFAPHSLANINTANEQSFIDIPREESVLSLIESYLELDFDVKVDDTKDRFLARVNLGPNASFS